MTREEGWKQSFELLKAYIEEHHHLPDKTVRQAHQPKENRGLLSWAKFQRKKIKAGTLDEEMVRQAHQPIGLFLELMDSRSKEHTGGRRKANV